MADERNPGEPLIETGPDQNNYDLPSNDPVPSPDDPGGAHRKGYSADPRPAPAVTEEGPIPLAEGPDEPAKVKAPDDVPGFRPTGRSDTGDYTPNKRAMGSDR